MIVGVNFCLEVFVVSTICDCGLVMEVLAGFEWFHFLERFLRRNSAHVDNFGRQKIKSEGQFWASDTLLIFIPIDLILRSTGPICPPDSRPTSVLTVALPPAV